MKDDAELVAAIRAGATDEFAELVQRHQRQVFSILGRYERNEHMVEDMAQEAFLKAWRGLAQYDGRAPFAHWLARITTRVALDHLRRQRRLRNEVPFEELGEDALDWLQAPEPPDSFSAQAARELLDLALRRLSAEEQVVLTLLELEGRSVKEIARQTGWSNVLVRVRAHRARKKLAGILRRMGGANA